MSAAARLDEPPQIDAAREAGRGKGEGEAGRHYDPQPSSLFPLPSSLFPPFQFSPGQRIGS
jgi:hypothetical protein